ncbi:hypothetical protein BV898_03847 [Hypsibius exemplaris]|uniref:F-box domain-containing protein n=1 Tax=Hypsibius exemplaris TaxID=2072580 RepID=A0A1W0X4Q6_HYPEX|nr:hypothetical protein BV898_03847 [Hypsibius exemplaris]
MKDLFRYCDLPTRCKLRQICQSWKRLVSLEDVNEVVVVDDSYLWISSTVPPKSDGGVKRPLQCNLIRPDAGNLIESRNVEDFRRDGLMGGHVRAIINQE